MMSPSEELTGAWFGHYVQKDKEYPITAEFLQEGQRLRGSMCDGQPDRDDSMFHMASEAGLQPGADEQIEARLRQIVPEAGAKPIRYFSHLPSAAALEGERRGQIVSFVKKYQGPSFVGFKVGEQLVGWQNEDHSVHYEGQLSNDGLLIEGRWWIEADPKRGIGRGDGRFLLRRLEQAVTIG